MKWYRDKIKKMGYWDITCVKLASMAFILFVITIWPAAMDLVHKVNPWWFLVATVVLSLKPIITAFR